MYDFIEKIKKIEALITRGGTEGEKQAAKDAKERLLAKHTVSKVEEKLTEYSLYTSDAWHKQLLVAICRKHGLTPYRYRRQKYTTVMVKVNSRFLNRVLWPEYLEYSKHLEGLVEDITNQLIEKIHKHEEDIVQKELPS